MKLGLWVERSRPCQVLIAGVDIMSFVGTVDGWMVVEMQFCNWLGAAGDGDDGIMDFARDLLRNAPRARLHQAVHLASVCDAPVEEMQDFLALVGEIQSDGDDGELSGEEVVSSFT